MDLKTQILSFFFSFSYGIIVGYLYNLFHAFLYLSKAYHKVFINILFSLDVFLIYFLLLKKINNGIIHIYFLIVMIIGFILILNKQKK